MKANGCKTNVMVGASKCSPMAIPIKGAIMKENPMAKEFIPGLMVRFTMASGDMELKMDMVSGKELQENHTSVSGSTAKQKVTVFMFGKTTISTRESGSKTLDMVTVVTFSIMETFMSGSMFMVNLKDLDSTSGKMDLPTLALS